MCLRCMLAGARSLLWLRAPSSTAVQLVPARSAAAKTSAAGGAIMGLGKGKKKLTGKLGALEKRVIPVESDATRLVSHVCGSNIYLTGEDVQVKPDGEYPAWLWDVRTGPPPPLADLDPDSKEYWQRVRTAGMRRNNQLRKLRRF